MPRSQTAAPQGKSVARTTIGRSLDVYYRDEPRAQRMDALNAQFVSKGSLAFDIGAHVGDRTGSLPNRQMGVLRPIVLPAAKIMMFGKAKILQRSAVLWQFVGNDGVGNEALFLQQFPAARGARCCARAST